MLGSRPPGIFTIRANLMLVGGMNPYAFAGTKDLTRECICPCGKADRHEQAVSELLLA